MILHLVRFRPMSTTAIPVPPILATLIGRIAAAVPGRARATFTELLIGAAVTRGGHVTDAILAIGLSRAWTTYYWLLERGRWSWLPVWRALLEVLEELFAPPVWHVIVDDTVVERISAGAPGSLIHHNHTAKPNRPRFLTLAAARHPYRRPDPSGHRAHFARGRSARPRRGDPARIPHRPAQHQPATAGYCQSRVARPI